MKRTRIGVAAALLIALAAACDDNGGPAVDSTAPARINDLAITAVTSTSFTLAWTASGDDGHDGRATSYVLRRSSSLIDAANFGAATLITGLPAPAVAGAAESFTVTGLDSLQNNYFAIRAVDDAGNKSPISNVAEWSPHLVKTIPADRDNTMYEEGDWSNGQGWYLFTGENANGVVPPPDARRALIRFAIADSLPAGAVIDSVRLTLHASKGAPHAPGDTLRVATLHRLTADWGEGASDAGDPGGGGATALTGDATWTFSFFNTVNWATPGGDFVAAPSASTMIGIIGPYTWTGTTMTTDAQSWLDSPGTNFGWVVIGDEAQPSSARRLDSRENTPARAPKLTIYYTPGP